VSRGPSVHGGANTERPPQDGLSHFSVQLLHPGLGGLTKLIRAYVHTELSSMRAIGSASKDQVQEFRRQEYAMPGHTVVHPNYNRVHVGRVQNLLTKEVRFCERDEDPLDKIGAFLVDALAVVATEVIVVVWEGVEG
jgi:hypothetical protein